jgi:hypothetical protein
MTRPHVRQCTTPTAARHLAVLMAVAAYAAAPPRPCDLTIAQLMYGGGGDWYANPSSLPNLVKAVAQRTRVALCDTVATVAITDERLFQFPFIYMTGHGNVHFAPEERSRLRLYLESGGFLWADDNYGMDESFRREMQALFPDHPLTPIPSSHPLFSSFYRLPGLPKIHEHDGKPAQALGVFFGSELVVLYTYSSDIGDGMEDLEVHNDGPELHEAALRMGVNVVTWFLRP